jgi:hypothetical protein
MRSARLRTPDLEVRAREVQVSILASREGLEHVRSMQRFPCWRLQSEPALRPASLTLRMQRRGWRSEGVKERKAGTGGHRDAQLRRDAETRFAR